MVVIEVALVAVTLLGDPQTQEIKTRGRTIKRGQDHISGKKERRRRRFIRFKGFRGNFRGVSGVSGASISRSIDKVCTFFEGDLVDKIEDKMAWLDVGSNPLQSLPRASPVAPQLRHSSAAEVATLKRSCDTTCEPLLLCFLFYFEETDLFPGLHLG